MNEGSRRDVVFETKFDQFFVEDFTGKWYNLLAHLYYVWFTSLFFSLFVSENDEFQAQFSRFLFSTWIVILRFRLRFWNWNLSSLLLKFFSFFVLYWLLCLLVLLLLLHFNLFLLLFAFTNLWNALSDQLFVIFLIFFCVEQEGMFEEFKCWKTLSWVFDKTFWDEISEFTGPLFVNLGRLERNNVDNLTWFCLSQIWRGPVGELECKNSETPHVNLRVILPFALNQLRRHPAKSAHFGVTTVLFLRQLSRVAKISQFTGPISIGQNVVTLDVSVHYVATVQIGKADEGLAEDVLQRIFCVQGRKAHLAKNCCQRAGHQLNNNPQLAPIIKGLFNLQDTVIFLVALFH